MLWTHAAQVVRRYHRDAADVVLFHDGVELVSDCSKPRFVF
jgi:hypothetical protein